MNCPCTGGMPHCGNKECEDLCCECINLALKVACTEAGQGEELNTCCGCIHEGSCIYLEPCEYKKMPCETLDP